MLGAHLADEQAYQNRPASEVNAGAGEEPSYEGCHALQLFYEHSVMSLLPAD